MNRAIVAQLLFYVFLLAGMLMLVARWLQPTLFSPVIVTAVLAAAFAAAVVMLLGRSHDEL